VSVLSPERRKELEQACVRGRRAAEAASRAAIGALGVLDERPAAHLSDEERDLRRALRAKREQLGDRHGQIELLAGECAYEQWHRLLFARFLAENKLLIHPQFGVQVTLAECDELAADLGEPDSWAVAGRFAAEILPGIFRLDDPCVRLRLAPEGRLTLEQIVESIPADTFAADDALGWVYQHWQKERKDEVNAAERKIGGADLAPVTQLFTENYMVRFLLENSLGAWWASRYPDSPLIHEWEYLRVDDDGKPAAGAFEGWPSTVAEVTVMDPCCGSGHFLVETFRMLWRMRAEEERLAPVPAQDAVLRDNLFGLELDPRCVEIAMFAVAVAAWKAGDGWRELPVPNVACSGIPVRASLQEWRRLSGGDMQLENALERLHVLFREADSLGSLIDPRQSTERTDPSGRQQSLDDVAWGDITPLLEWAGEKESRDPASAVMGADASGLVRAATYLSKEFTLVATNVPYLKRANQRDNLRTWIERNYPDGTPDLAMAFLLRGARFANAGSTAMVVPYAWVTSVTYEPVRRRVLDDCNLRVLALLGTGAFTEITGEVVNVTLVISDSVLLHADDRFIGLDAAASRAPAEKLGVLKSGRLVSLSQQRCREAPSGRIILSSGPSDLPLLSAFAGCFQGTSTGDNVRFCRMFWELPSLRMPWARWQSTVGEHVAFGGREQIVYWGGDDGVERCGAAIRGRAAWQRQGVAVSQMGRLFSTLYGGDLYDNNVAALVPKLASDLPAIYAFVCSDEFHDAVREIDQSMKVMNATLPQVPFDVERWRREAERLGPLPEPHSEDPVQWLFKGRPEGATEPLQVAVARLLGYRWPEHVDADDLDPLTDGDGIVCLPSVLGERAAADRLQELLARAFGGTWSPARATELLTATGSKKTDIESWLRDEFFKAHCQIFKNRPFIWQIWDGRKDGFSALLNYHRLDRPTLGRLAYTYLGDWIERQAAGAREDVIGAEERLIAARELQRKLELILAGEPPYDIYVRWKPIGAQAVGWAPDPDDGVRLNVRPFVQAGVLRAKFNVKWEKDRGKNPDGSERHNDLHLTNAQKQNARDSGAGV
jgi:hypothetical protein